VVKFNGTAATVTNATSTQLTVTLPSTATSGKITVTTHDVAGTSIENFSIGCPDVIVTDVTLSNVSGDVFDVTYHIKNIGSVPLNINAMYLQVYISKTIGMDDSQFAGAGGDPTYGSYKNYDLLAPNAILELSSTQHSGGSIITYPYAIVTIGRFSDGPVECNTTNNKLGIKIQP